MPTRTSKNALTAEIVGTMTQLGTYRPEYDGMIAIYVDTLIDYRRQLAGYKKGGSVCYIPTAQGMKKSPVVTTIESDRKDLLAYGEALGLTPRANKKIMDGQVSTKTAEPESGDEITRRLEEMLGINWNDSE